jgi:hypothetical protein
MYGLSFVCSSFRRQVTRPQGSDGIAPKVDSFWQQMSIIISINAKVQQYFININKELETA